METTEQDVPPPFGVPNGGALQGIAVNEALLIAGLREHELREKAERLAEELRVEIEHRKASDDRVHASEVKFRRLFETAESGILMLNAASMLITDANPFFCELVQYTRAELVGRGLWATKLFADENSIGESFLKLKELRHIRDGELPLRTKLGRMIQVGFVANRYDEGGVEVIQCSVLDISETKRLLNIARAASLAAEKANSTKDIFLAALSHELRTPLNPALLLASYGASNSQFSLEIRGDFAAIEKNILLEARLIDELLDFTKITRGKLSLRTEAVSFNEVLRDALANVKSEREAKSITLSLALDGNPVLCADAMRLQQVFWNVLKNAVKFTPVGGNIAVRSSIDASRGMLEVTFSDNGIGIAPGDLETIFAPFAQGGQGKNNGALKYGGLGLGLAIARNILELHDGTIRAASKGEGLGSEFGIELPLLLAEMHVQPRNQVQLSSADPARKDRIRILLVEDDEESRTVCERLLSARDFDVTSAGTFSDGLRIASLRQFDLLISDIGLPDGNGLDLLEPCTRMSPEIRGIAISGYGMKPDIDKSTAARFSVHLVKPIGIASLEKALAAAIDSKPSPQPILAPFDRFQEA